MPASVRCQPMCGRLNLRDFETAVGGGWAAFTRRGSGDSHEARSSTGIRCMFGTSVRTYQGVIFAQTTICGVLLIISCACPDSGRSWFRNSATRWFNRHAPMARHDSDNPAPAAPPRAPISLPAGRRRDTRVGSRPHTLGVTSSQFPSGSATLPDPTPV